MPRKPTVSEVSDETQPISLKAEQSASRESVKEETPRENEVTIAIPRNEQTEIIEEPDHGNDEYVADLTEADMREIYEAIDLIRRKLAFAKDFSEEEKRNLMRLGKSGRTFVEKAQNLVAREPGILPRSFDVEEFKRDAELYQELGNLSDELHSLAERVADTEAAVGSDAFTASLVVYQSGKLARTGDDMDNHLACWRRKRSELD